MTRLTGPLGWAKLGAFIPQTPDQEATLATWFLWVPSASPAWQHYLLSVIHLRDLPGVPPARREYPEASHELIVVALDSSRQPTADDPATWHHLLPVNVVVQFHGVSDDGARNIARLAAQACLDGVLWIEPTGIYGARDAWTQSIRLTAEHEATGGHDA